MYPLFQIYDRDNGEVIHEMLTLEGSGVENLMVRNIIKKVVTDSLLCYPPLQCPRLPPKGSWFCWALGISC